MQKLDIVYRVSDIGDVHPERGPRFIETDKKTLIKKCFLSLLISTNEARKNYDIKFIIVSDRTSEDILNFITQKLTFEGYNFVLHRCEQEGYNYSALKQFEFCKNGREWVYSVEDDYLHFPQAIKELMDNGILFTNNFRQPVAIRPDDDAFTYSPNSLHSKLPCKVFLGKNRHWRTLNCTHNTLFTHKDVFVEFWDLFSSLAKYFRKLSISENETINLIWNNRVNNEGAVPLLSPIPTLAIHVSQGNEPHLVNWKQLWNSIEV